VEGVKASHDPKTATARRSRRVMVVGIMNELTTNRVRMKQQCKQARSRRQQTDVLSLAGLLVVIDG